MVENRLGLFFLRLTVEHWFGLSVHGSPQSGHWTWSLWLPVPSPQVKKYKWEVYCWEPLSSALKSQEGTAIEIGGVLPYKLELYCSTFERSGFYGELFCPFSPAKVGSFENGGAPESAQNNRGGPIPTQHDFPYLLCEGERFLRKCRIIPDILFRSSQNYFCEVRNVVKFMQGRHVATTRPDWKQQKEKKLEMLALEFTPPLTLAPERPAASASFLWGAHKKPAIAMPCPSLWREAMPLDFNRLTRKTPERCNCNPLNNPKIITSCV